MSRKSYAGPERGRYAVSMFRIVDIVKILVRERKNKRCNIAEEFKMTAIKRRSDKEKNFSAVLSMNLLPRSAVFVDQTLLPGTRSIFVKRPKRRAGTKRTLFSLQEEKPISLYIQRFITFSHVAPWKHTPGGASPRSPYDDNPGNPSGRLILPNPST